jgi:hypothetical protein
MSGFDAIRVILNVRVLEQCTEIEKLEKMSRYEYTVTRSRSGQDHAANSTSKSLDRLALVSKNIMDVRVLGPRKQIEILRQRIRKAFDEINIEEALGSANITEFPGGYCVCSSCLFKKRVQFDNWGDLVNCVRRGVFENRDNDTPCKLRLCFVRSALKCGLDLLECDVSHLIGVDQIPFLESEKSKDCHFVITTDAVWWSIHLGSKLSKLNIDEKDFEKMYQFMAMLDNGFEFLSDYDGSDAV